jgi:glycosyl transferase, family 25
MINDFFDTIVCVNLDRRTDKWELCKKEFTKHNLNVSRFSAVDGTTVPYEGRLPVGAIGNALSHARILRYCEYLELDSVLILEDDVEFDDKIQEKFEHWVEQVPRNWDFLYLGGNHNWVEMPLFSPNLVKIYNTYSTHAYAVRNTMFKALYEALETLSTEGDIITASLQKDRNSFCFYPNLAYQRPGISDVFNKFVDYSFLNPNR